MNHHDLKLETATLQNRRSNKILVMDVRLPVFTGTGSSYDGRGDG